MQVFLAKQGCIDGELALVVVQDGQGKRHFGKAVDDLAHQVSTLVAKEQAGEYLNLEIGAQLDLVQSQPILHGSQHMAGVPLQVGKRALQLEVLHNRDQRLVQRLARGVIGPEGRLGRRLVVLDVLGADGGAHKDEVVVEMRAVQDLAGDRVEKGLCQFRLVVVDEQPDVVELGLVPHLHGLAACAKLLLQPPHAFLHPQVIKLDALALCPLLAQPVSGFKTVLGTGRFGAEQAVMAVKTVHHRLCDGIGQR